MQTWIIQFNPQEWSLKEHLQGILDGRMEREGEWPVQRYYRKMQAGDRLLLWQSGTESGLKAIGVLISNAYQSLDDASEDWFVGYRLEDYLQPFLARSELKQISDLRHLSILKRPQGQVFAVKPNEANLLAAAYKERLFPLPLKSDPGSLPVLARKIQQQGLLLSVGQIRRYHLALETGSLLILAGPSGMGKSWLTSAYAQARGAAYQMISVAPNWTSPEDLLGYYNALSSSFQASTATRFIQEAAQHWQLSQQQGLPAKPYHLVLDEINLARVEYYLAPFLSALEVRRRGEPAFIALADGSQLLLPDNLFLIGSLNMDETTLSLSDKVFDRAQFLELHMQAEFLKTYLPESEWRDVLLNIWSELKELTPFSYRSLQDIDQYIECALDLGCSWETALDEQLVQKLFPRLHYLKPGHLSLLMRLLNDLPEGFNLSRQKLQHMCKQIQDMGFGSYL